MTLQPETSATAIPRNRSFAAMRPAIGNFLDNDSGQDLIEYALLLALVGLTGMVALKGLTNNIRTLFNTVGADITPAT
jgi:pilus assembly protein Flp/PilA